MEDNTPKDVSFANTKKAHVFHVISDSLVFNAFNVDIKQESGIDNYGRKFQEILIFLKGQVVYSSGIPNIQTICKNGESCRVEMEIKRTDVIEILKYGNYIKLLANGYISGISYGFEYPIISIVVNGNINIL